MDNAEIAKLPLSGRNVLGFALLVPGAATSAGSRDSEYNGLPGGAINITLDGCCHHEAGIPPDEESMRYWTAAMERADALILEHCSIDRPRQPGVGEP